MEVGFSFLWYNFRMENRETAQGKQEDVMAEFEYCKLEIFIPETHLAVLQQALQERENEDSRKKEVS